MASQPLTTFLQQPAAFHEACSTIYSPLDRDKAQIRLVHIHPGLEIDKVIHLTLETLSLDDHPAFQAISYTWGDLSPTEQVLLEDVPYNVTQNQYDVLRRFRLADEVRIMWMDVICVNEADVAERSWQVSMMSRIYSYSQQTQIWLGELDEKFLNGLSDEQWSSFETRHWQTSDRKGCTEDFACTLRDELMPDFSSALDQPDGRVHAALRILRLLSEGQHLYDLPMMYLDSDGTAQLFPPWFESMIVFRSILQKPWWRRVWTIQEALLSPSPANIQFGKYAVSFSQFMHLGQSFVDHMGTTGSCCQWWSPSITYSENDEDQANTLENDLMRILQVSIYLRRIKDEPMSTSRLWYGLGSSNMMGTMDHRDYVYGILGLVPDDDRVPVDYAASTSEVY